MLFTHRLWFSRSHVELLTTPACSLWDKPRLKLSTASTSNSWHHVCYSLFLGPARPVSYVMLRATCCLVFRRFLCAGEFNVNSNFDPSMRLTVQVDAEVNPSSLCVHIKTTKTDHFLQGFFVYMGCGWASLCLITAIMAYLHLQGSSQGPLFIDRAGQPLSHS